MWNQEYIPVIDAIAKEMGVSASEIESMPSTYETFYFKIDSVCFSSKLTMKKKYRKDSVRRVEV